MFRTTYRLPVLQLGQVRVAIWSSLVTELAVLLLDALLGVGPVEVAGHGVVAGHRRGRIRFDWQLIVLPHKRGGVLRLLSME